MRSTAFFISRMTFRIWLVFTTDRSRCFRLQKRLDEKALARIEAESGGVAVGELGKALILAVDADAIVADALTTARAQGITRSEDTLLPAELEVARAKRVAAACAPFDKPKLRNEIENARRDREQLIDHVNLDRVLVSGFSEQTDAQARTLIQTFSEYLAAHKDEIAALSFLFRQSFRRRQMTFDMVGDLHEHLSKPPLMLTTEKLWHAYARVQGSRVKGSDRKRQLTDLV